MKRVLISGAGIAGLTAALWFEKLGYAVTVVERAPSIRGGGYLVSLSDYAYRAAAELDKNCYAIFRTRTVLTENSRYAQGA